MAEAGWGVVERRESFPGTVAGRAACWEEEAWGGRNPHPRGSRGPQGDGKTLSGASWTCCVLVHGQIWPLKLLTHSLLIITGKGLGSILSPTSPRPACPPGATYRPRLGVEDGAKASLSKQGPGTSSTHRAWSLLETLRPQARLPESEPIV